MAGAVGALPSHAWQHAGHPPWLVDLETKTIRGKRRCMLRPGCAMLISRRMPSGAPGLGRACFDKDVWPTARLGIYCEFFYHAHGADVGLTPSSVPAMRMRRPACGSRMSIICCTSRWLMRRWRPRIGRPARFPSRFFAAVFRWCTMASIRRRLFPNPARWAGQRA